MSDPTAVSNATGNWVPAGMTISRMAGALRSVSGVPAGVLAVFPLSPDAADTPLRSHAAVANPTLRIAIVTSRMGTLLMT
jgi:hypothetical protein